MGQSDYRVEPGSATLEFTADVHILEALVNLKEGRIFPKDVVHSWAYLNAQPFIPDAIILHEKIILPRIFYYDLEHEVLLDKLDDLTSSKIIEVPEKEIASGANILNLTEELADRYASDPTYLTAVAVASPHKKIFRDLIKEAGINVIPKEEFNPWFGGGFVVAAWIEEIMLREPSNLSKLRQKIEQKIKQEKFRRRVSMTAVSQLAYTDIPVVADGYLGPINRIFLRNLHDFVKHKLTLMKKNEDLSRSIGISFDILFSKIDELREEIEDFVRKNWPRTRYLGIFDMPLRGPPYSVALIVKELEKNEGPKKFYEKMLELRKEFRGLRSQLRDCDEKLANHMFAEFARCLKNLIDLIEKAEESYEYKKNKINIRQNTGVLSNMQAAIARIPLSMLVKGTKSAFLSIGPSEIIQIAKELKANLSKWKEENMLRRLHLRDLFQASLTSINYLREDLERAFGEDGEKFASTLAYLSAVSRLVDTLLSGKGNF